MVSWKKKIAKSAQLIDQLYMKSVGFGPNDIGNRRIVICGTENGTLPHIFFAVFNADNNVTEFLYENPYTASEYCRNIEIDINNNQCILNNNANNQ